MKPEMSETMLPGRKIDLWTPWGILRLTDPGDAAKDERKPLPRAWMRPAGDRPAREGDVGTHR